MKEYCIDQSDLMKWCSVPAEELENHPSSKINIIIKSTSSDVMETIGNMMADEIIKNNAEGKPTTWILPSDPFEQYKTFTDRVNAEGISLKNLTVFHIGYPLDWNSRIYPQGDYYESAHGRMQAHFYDKIDPKLNVLEENRVWPLISNLDEIDERIIAAGGVDTAWTNIGYKGSVGFCESPHCPLERVTLDDYEHMKTRFVELNHDTVILSSVRNGGGCFEIESHQAVALGFGSILKAKRCVAIFNANQQLQTALRVLAFSEPTLEYPATILPKHIPQVTAVCDTSTAMHPLAGK